MTQLITDTQKVLTDPETKPEDYNQISTQLATSISETQQKFQNAQSDPQIENLTKLVEMAQTAKKATDEKSDLWKEFTRRLNEINELHDEARKPLTSVTETGRKPAKEVQNIVEFLNVRFLKHLQFIITNFRMLKNNWSPFNQNSTSSPPLDNNWIRLRLPRVN
jgi:hypothetical protein